MFNRNHNLENTSIVIIGSGTAAVSAAQSIRKYDKDIEVTLITDETVMEYSRCGLPYYISGVVDKFENLVEYSIEWLKNKGIKVMTDCRVKSISPVSQTIYFDCNNAVNSLHYEKLIIATGSRPKIPHLEGVYKNDGKLIENIFTLRTNRDAECIKKIEKGMKVVIVGAGLTGVETAEALSSKGIEVSIVEFFDSVLPSVFEKDITAELTKNIRNNGIKLYLASAVKEILSNGEMVKGVVVSAAEKEIKMNADYVIISAGNKPNSEMAIEANIKHTESKHIIVDDHMKTDMDNVFAAGDVTAMYAPYAKGYVAVGTGSIATRQGLIAGANAIGKDEKFNLPFVNARTTQCFDVELAAVGASGFELDNNKVKYITYYYEGDTHPRYMPWNRKVQFKFFLSEDGQLLGAHCSGNKASQRINILSLAMAKEVNIKELHNMEFAYAPAVSPVLDPMYIALTGLYIKWKRITAYQ